MNPPKRQKRDSPDNLYRQCQLTGNCLPDVKNKIEGTTLADRLLKWFSSIIYLGGLGIGTGKGTGGSMGYNPLSTPSRVIPDGTIIRPTVPVEPIGPVEMIPIDVLQPEASAIVPLEEGGLPTITESTDIIETAVDTVQPEDNILTSVDPINDITTSGGHPTIITSGEEAAILEVQPAPPATRRIAMTGTKYSSTPHLSVITGNIPQDSNINVFVDAHFSGEVVGSFEEIPLEPLNQREEFQIEAGRTTSTPKDTISQGINRIRHLYNRRVLQQPTKNVDFLGQASRAVQFEFENPAFDPEITLRFNQDVADIATAAPDTAFSDIVTLGRPIFSETESGLVRVSRLGQRGTIKTRSGLRIGQNVHFYFDVSTIDSSDAIELLPIGQTSADLSIVDELAESTFVDPIAQLQNTAFTDADLDDPLTESFDNSHLVLTTSNRRGTVSFPALPPELGLRVFVDDVGKDLFISYPETHITPAIVPNIPFGPDVPVLVYDFASADFTLHPSLLRKRKRRPSF
uniref:Minor capsid protein L2 n=1 Tax=Human papillomavirus TaxID=10566 RepID=A0A385PLB2_9PAPI|nr:MAG: L2 protein [Human papillomavirus]